MDVITKIQQAVIGVKSQVAVGVAIKVFADVHPVVVTFNAQAELFAAGEIFFNFNNVVIALDADEGIVAFEFLRQFDCIVFTVVADTEFAQQFL